MANANAEQIAEISKAGYDNAAAGDHVAGQGRKLSLNSRPRDRPGGVRPTPPTRSRHQGRPGIRAVLQLTEAGVQNALGYSRGVYQIASEAQADFSALAEEAWAAYTKGFAVWVDKATKNAPAGSDVAVTALKSTMAATTAAFDQFSKATKQVVSFADASVRAAAANAANATKPAGKGRKAA